MLKNKNWLSFEIIIIFKEETLNLQAIKTLSNLLKIDEKRKCHVLGQL